MLELCVPSRLEDTPNQTEAHDLNPFSKTNLHNKWCCSFVPQSPAFCFLAKNRTKLKYVGGQHMICTPESDILIQKTCGHLLKLWQGDALIFSHAATYNCVVFLMQQTLFFSVVLSRNVVTKGSQLKAAAVGYLLMWCGTQPTPTHQYASLLWWWASVLIHLQTGKFGLHQLLRFEFFNFVDNAWRGLPPCLKGIKRSRFHDCYWLEQRTGWQHWLHFSLWLPK